MRHIRPTSKRLPLPAFTINLKCVPCMLVGRVLGNTDEEIRTKCEDKVGEPCVT